MTIRFVLTSALGKFKARRLSEKLAAALSKAAGVPVEALVADSYGDLYRILTGGEAQIGWCPAAVCTKLERNARAVFAAVREGVATYQAALVGRQDRRLSLSNLQGTRAAWVDRFSFGGYLLALEFLKRQRIDPDKTFVAQEFLGSYPAAVSAVLEGRADVSSITVARSDDEAIRKTMAAIIGAGSSRLSVIGMTDSIPSDALVVMRTLGEDFAGRVIERIAEAKQFDDVCSVFNCEGFERARPGDYKVMALTRCLGLIDFSRQL